MEVARTWGAARSAGPGMGRWALRAARRVAGRMVPSAGVRQEMDLRDPSLLYREIFEAAPVAIAVLDDRRRLVDGNAELRRLLGRSPTDLRSRPLESVAVPGDSDRLAAAVSEADRAAGRPVVVEHRYVRAGGSQGWARTALRRLPEGDSRSWMVCTVEDVTRDQEALQEQRRQAEQDPLTGLLNRRGGDRRLRSALEKMALAGPVAVIICDADGLKQINDRYGHAAGDAALVNLARRLRGAVRAGDDVARMGGDEFIVVARVATLEEAETIADRCVHAVGEPLGRRAGGPEHVTISAGVAVALPGQSVDPGRLLAEADRALYDAKRQGGHRWHVAGRPAAAPEA